MELLLEKYFSYSPFSYSILNPLKFKDVNGKDAIAEIDEKNKSIKIRIHLNYSRYSKVNKAGLQKNQIQFLNDLKEEVEELWSGNVYVNDEEYLINIIVE